MTRIGPGKWLGKPALCVAAVTAVAVLAAGCANFRQTEWGTGIGTATGAAAGYALAGDDSKLAGALIGGAVGGGTGYLIGSHLEGNQQREVMQEYNRLMKMDDKGAVNRGIDQVGDTVLGNSDRQTTAQERNEALAQLEYAMETAADEMGDRNGTCTTRERNLYVNKYGDRPLVQILTGNTQ